MWLLIGILAAVVSGSCSGCKGYGFQLGEIHFVDQREGWASAYFWPPINGSGLSTFFHTTDGGRHWRRLPFVWQTGAEPEPSFAFVGREHGWIAWDDQEGNSYLSRTTNGGRTWVHRPAQPMKALHFFDRLHGCAVGAAHGPWSFLTTSDGGATWESNALPLTFVDAMSFADARNGVMVGGGPVAKDAPIWDGPLRILVTHDGGAHWADAHFPRRPYGNARTLAWLDTKTAFLAVWGDNDNGTELLRTSDGGDNWTRHPDASLQGTGKYVSVITLLPDGRVSLFHWEKSGRSYLSTSTDRGATWSTRSFPYDVSSCEVVAGDLWCSSGMNIVKVTSRSHPTQGSAARHTADHR